MKDDRGASTLELAFVAPLLFIVALGIVDMGRALATTVPVSEAAQEGLTYAAYEPTETDEIIARILFSTTDPDLKPENITISCPSAPADHVAITVEYDLELMTPFVADMLGGTVRVSKTVIGEIFSEDPCTAS
ncbi:MAG: pilus assembly protein [Acidimicrobiia bacterium]|nr:pilus assembly protein [Acidimicrobiia bacterium]NNF10637.1 pilus assembly protein [Acidimicrobiia bacterium]NNL70811.1 pilus assembly protein [Acidimicrobiia bacterium]